jgi:thioredoxin-related protein
MNFRFNSLLYPFSKASVMRPWKLTAIMLVLVSLCCEICAAEELVRIHNLEEGKQKAKSAGKDLFILFTGNGWCYYCIMLDQKILQKQKFAETLSQDFVFVELVFNSEDTPEQKARNAILRKLQHHYLTPAVPTAVLADCDGKPYAFITGYEKGTEPQGYLKLITAAQSAKSKRDALLTAAAQEAGTARASLLNDALESIASQLGTIDERGEEPLLHFYGDVVQEILDLTENQGKIANKYITLRSQRDAWIADHAVLEKLKNFQSSKDYAGGIRLITQALKTTKNPEVRWELELTRETYLEWDDQFKQALTHCQRLLAIENIPEEIQETLLDREAFNLVRLNRFDEALARFDRRLQAASSDREKRQKILNWQVQLMLKRAPVEKSIEVCRRLQKATKHGTDDWKDATFFLALELRRAGRHREALELTNDFLQVERSPNQLLDAAESLIALKRHTEAAELFKEVRPHIQSLKASHLKWEIEQSEHLAERSQELKKRMSQPDSSNGK